MSNVADRAHAAATKVLAGFAAANMTLDFPLDAARTACGCDGIDPDSREGSLYVERFAGHVINVQCGTAGL